MSIEITELSKSYDTQKAIDAVSFSIQNGEIVGFLGPNGAGKSTLMKILTGYLIPDSGEAIVNGFNIDHQIQEVKKSIGYLPEHNPQYLDLYVREYLSFNAQVYGVEKLRIEEVIQLTGLTPEAHKKIGQLSKGYRQRVGIANALLHNPEVLILDEPTTGLDPNQLLEIRELIKNIGKNKTVFLSTHIMQEVEAICDRVIIINKGKIVADKKIDKLSNGNIQLIEVEFDLPITEELLLTIPEITAAILMQNNVWQLSFVSLQDVRVLVFDFAQANGLKTLQLTVKNKNLESLFRELTQS
ncbi:gliding motility-associated ABC transporter ATP-binding subunit GldA [Flavobacterium sp. UBA7682]|uniref:gliding motility-associated ABC transporter ATP-binding subunit GldA n=1 Tax=Flavobacterium sp. UBA7682 TaxID=1946560 RepID=UPI0025B93262|nr:gliding motility-associated ABC transporter ATP-binding subunit GldA [Flavobacterium sp. UBA7682]